MKAAPDQSDPAGHDLDAAADQAIAACGGDAREAVKALLVANEFLEAQLDELRKKVSRGYQADPEVRRRAGRSQHAVIPLWRRT